MDTVRQWALTVCVCAVVGAIVCMLSPKGTMGKSVKVSVSLFMLIALLSPFTKGIDFSDFVVEPLPENNSSDISETITEEMTIALETKITEILARYGIKAESIDIDISIDSENNMTVERLKIFVSDTDSEALENARRAVKDEIGADVIAEVNK